MSEQEKPEAANGAEEVASDPLPRWELVVKSMRTEYRPFGFIEYFGAWWFWHWRNSCGFRWLCEAVIVVAVFAGVAGLYWDIEARQEERQEWAKGRAVDHAQLLAQIAALAKDAQFKDPANPTYAEVIIAAKAGAGIAPIMTLLAREKVSMRRLNVAGVLFPVALNLNNADLSYADLSRADLIVANLSGADLSGADLSVADLSGADLSGADLSVADLSGANLSRADLSNADLSNANLIWAKLIGADLSNADLSNADLSNANLIWAKLIGAKLSDADLSDADLSGARLSYVKKLTQEQLDRACIREGYKPPTLYGAEDPETEKPLVWRGQTCPE